MQLRVSQAGLFICQAGFFTQIHLLSNPMSCFPKQFEQVIRSFSGGEIIDIPVHTTNNFMCVD